jgi:hypothetical protein
VIVINILSRASLISMAGAAVLMGGCATRESVEHAQGTADQAMSAAQHAQQTADQALSTAQGAQQSVDQMKQEEMQEEQMHHHRGQRG